MQVHWRDSRGFTLVELMIVVIVVGILAAVAIPMYQVIPERSRATEAVAGLDAIREGMRVYFAEHGRYDHASFVDGARVTVGEVLGIKDIDLSGRYFSSECYTFDGNVGANTFTIECDGSSSTASAASDVSGTVATIDESGEIATSW
jgi:type IV pilus assembly protein PilE